MSRLRPEDPGQLADRHMVRALGMLTGMAAAGAGHDEMVQTVIMALVLLLAESDNGREPEVQRFIATTVGEMTEACPRGMLADALAMTMRTVGCA